MPERLEITEPLSLRFLLSGGSDHQQPEQDKNGQERQQHAEEVALRLVRALIGSLIGSLGKQE